MNYDDDDDDDDDDDVNIQLRAVAWSWLPQVAWKSGRRLQPIWTSRKSSKLCASRGPSGPSVLVKTG